MAYALFVGSWAVLNSLVLVLVTPSSFPRLCVLAALSAGGWAATWTLGWAMIGDVVEVDEFKTDERREGLYFGVAQFIQKLATGAVLFAGGWILSLVGYAPKVEQSNTALLGIRLTLCLGVSLLLAAATALALLCPITKQKHDALRRAIGLRKEGQPFSTDEFEGLLG
jgi:Na+/melibiose symporter-like transporter